MIELKNKKDELISKILPKNPLEKRSEEIKKLKEEEYP